MTAERLCRWFKCWNELPADRPKYCTDGCATNDRKHRQRQLRVWRDTIAALKPGDHALVERVVDRQSYRIALEEISRSAERERDRRDREGVEILCPTAHGLRKLAGPPFVRRDIQDVFLEERHRRRRRDSAGWVRWQANDDDSNAPTPLKAYDAETTRRRRADAAYEKAFKDKPPRAMSLAVQDEVRSPVIAITTTEREKVNA